MILPDILRRGMPGGTCRAGIPYQEPEAAPSGSLQQMPEHTRMRRTALALALLLAAGAGLYVSRNTWIPLMQQHTGKQTVASVQARLTPEVLARLRPDLARAGLARLPEELILLAFKEERRLEVHVKQPGGTQLLKTYPFTAFSGTLGPKLREGDRQIPEGIYRIESLNPNSAYYLSMKVSYPNAFDLKHAAREGRTEPGSDIFIHGKAVTIGCIPVGDEAIEELFVLVAHAMRTPVQVIICPRDFRVNSQFPDIQGVSWAPELYAQLEAELARIGPVQGAN
jgi:L,D-peptidoglycan transpeptidase YkuD (ErfK/YbiS/YcfS/YnhG family)